MMHWVSAVAFIMSSVYNGSESLSILKKDDLGDNALNWIQQKEEKANVELSSAKRNLVEMVHKLIEEGKLEIDSSVDKALQDVSAFQHDVPEKCHSTATGSLTVLRRSKKDYFLSCVKNSKSVQEIAKISEKSEELGAGFFTMTQRGTNRIVECSKKGIMGAYECGTSAIWEVIQSVMGGYSEMKHFIVSFTARGTHARRDIHNCLHPEGIDIQDHVDKIMEDYHTCVRNGRSMGKTNSWLNS
uniref:Tyrosine--tRNA ligase n=1 Tax=Lygus hesperus TaxID=30085 RepID=A0A0A9Z9V0_LYGHE